MIPVLYNKNEQQFRTYGLGEISDIINPKVTRERNGQYILYFQYPQNAKFSDVFEEDMRIKSDAGVRTKWQTFEISRVIRKESQLIEVFAKHISQSLLKDALNPIVNVPSSNAQQALNIWNNNRIGDEDFDVWSDITTTNSTSWNIREVSNAFEALAGVQGSILDVWGGEFEFDNKTIRLHKEMGRKSPVPLEYGRNITGLEQDKQEDNIYTSIYPFATYTPEGDEEPITVTLPEYYVDGKYLDMYPKRKIQVVDFSGEFGHDDIPTVERLRTLANQYTETNEIGLPHENLKVEYIDLSKTLDYQEFQTMEEVELNDTLPIFYPKFGITNENAKVVIVNYDPIKEENISIELGVIGQSFRTVTTGGIGSRLDRIEQQQNETVSYIVNSKGNRIWYTTPDENMEHKIGDTWFEENGQYSRIRVWNGNQWETIIDSEDINKNADAIAAQQQDIEEAKQTADEAVDSINTAVANAGFTSLDDTLQNMNYITMSAEQNAQQAITNASDAYGLAQTSISEAQTAQANSLTALGQVEDVQTGVSNLSYRVDDVEAELELKADNTFMNEDGTLTTLSNAITFNAHRFSSDMSRIESRVESLSGEVNLVILRDAFEDRRIEANTVYPNVSYVDAGHNTMRELITVTGGESIALSKEATTPITNDTNWRVIFYDSQMGIISRPMTASDEVVLTVPNNATKMWVSWPKGSKPQIIRGSDFLPYRPNMADQMTIDEMVIFRNEYDEYADRTERRLSAIDNTGGRLEVAETLITQTADGLQTTVGKVDSQGSRLSTVEQTANGLQSEVYNADGSSKITQLATGVQSLVTNLNELEVGGRNLIKNSDKPIDLFDKGILRYKATSYVRTGQLLPDGTVGSVIEFGSSEADNGWLRFRPFKFEAGKEYTFSFWARRSTGGASLKLGIGINSEGNSSTQSKEVDVSTTWQRFVFTATISRDVNVYNFVELRPPRFTWNDDARYYIWRPQLERANVVSDWKEAPEDTQSQISQLAHNINLRVTKGELMSQINIEADRQLFQSGKILFDAENVVFSGTAWIPNSVIGNLSADKITSGELNTAVANSVFVNASSVAANTTNFIQSAWNGINSNLLVTGNTLTYTHTDGSFTRLNANGLFRFDGGSGYSTNYLFDIITVTGLNNDPNSPRWVQLPAVYKGKQFKALAVFTDGHGVTDSQYYNDLLTIRIVSYVDRPIIDYANARVPVIGYQRARHRTAGSINNYAIQVQILVQY